MRYVLGRLRLEGTLEPLGMCLAASWKRLWTPWPALDFECHYFSMFFCFVLLASRTPPPVYTTARQNPDPDEKEILNRLPCFFPDFSDFVLICCYLLGVAILSLLVFRP